MKPPAKYNPPSCQSFANKGDGAEAALAIPKRKNEYYFPSVPFQTSEQTIRELTTVPLTEQIHFNPLQRAPVCNVTGVQRNWCAEATSSRVSVFFLNLLSFILTPRRYTFCHHCRWPAGNLLSDSISNFAFTYVHT